jgi:hypothetical protein
MFLQIGDGVDDATWQFHRERNDYSAWIASNVKDNDLGEIVRSIENDASLAVADARDRIRAAIEERYTAAA